MDTFIASRFAALGLAIVPCGPAAAGPPPLDAASAKAFVESVYAHYKGSKASSWDPMSARMAPQLFEPSLVRLFASSAAAGSADDIGPLDGDPLCACQDPEGLEAIVTVDAVEGPNARATAVVRFPQAPQDEARTIRYDLAAVNGRWRIQDLHNPDYPSLRALLTEASKPSKP